MDVRFEIDALEVWRRREGTDWLEAKEQSDTSGRTSAKHLHSCQLLWLSVLAHD